MIYGVTIRGESRQKGVTEVNNAVNVIAGFTNHILPELQDGDHSQRPMIKASALKFVSTFRNQLDRGHLVEVLPFLIHQLGSPSVVVHSFAAFAIERILVTKDNPQFDGLRMKVGRQDIQPLLHPLFDEISSPSWIAKISARMSGSSSVS